MQIYSQEYLPEPVRALKFRQVKVSVRRGQGIPYFMVLNRAVAYPINNEYSLRRALVELESRGLEVQRVYSTISEFLNPRSLGMIRDYRLNNNIMLSTWMSLESDYDYTINVDFARYVFTELDLRSMNPILVSTGGRSVHTWFRFDYEKFLPVSYEYHNFKQKQRFDFGRRLWLERVARNSFLNRIFTDEGMKYADVKVAQDPNRVVPIVGTYNMQAKKWVTRITPEVLFGDPREIIRKTTIAPTLKFGQMYFVNE